MFETFAHWLLQIPSAVAAAPCGFMPGGCTIVNTGANLVPPVAQLLVYTAASVCILFIVYGGAQMILSFGDDGKVTQGRMSVIYAMVGFGLSLGAQTIISFFAARSSNASTRANPIVSLIEEAVDVMIELFNVAFIIMVIVAGYRLVFGRGEGDQLEAAKRMLIWGIIGALLVNLGRVLTNIILSLGL